MYLMKNGVSYDDWRRMAPWQRVGMRMTLQHNDMQFAQRLKDASGFSEAFGVLLARMLRV